MKGVKLCGVNTVLFHEGNIRGGGKLFTSSINIFPDKSAIEMGGGRVE
jgi:hypothetical protein